MAVSSKLAVFAKKPELFQKANSIAKKLNVPLLTEDPSEPSEVDKKLSFDYLLEVTPHQLLLVKQKTRVSPLFVDFLSPQLLYRCKKANFKNEILVRALGLKKNQPLKIIDATGGMGRDSFILSWLGFEVIVLERSPLIFLLLEDGLKRLTDHPSFAFLAERMTLIEADTLQWLPLHSDNTDLIYLDPMFPERQKAAAVKKEMQFFQDLIPAQNDQKQLLQTALTCAKKRVVVKRPRLAPSIEGTPPSFSLNGSSSRFDIYLI